jgi:hypothetical protein
LPQHASQQGRQHEIDAKRRQVNSPWLKSAIDAVQVWVQSV